ncbi:hypothetical protein DFQ26_004689 [Actinomortierella ambigua]|nr:hypothetical protein DFQ26_004689 [Actinomortierella ambigua]
MPSSKSSNEKAALEGSSPNPECTPISTKPSSAQTLGRPLFQRLRLTVASDAIYLCEHLPDHGEQAATVTPASTTTPEVSQPNLAQSFDRVPHRKTLRIAYAQQPGPVTSQDGEGEKANPRVELLTEDVPDDVRQKAREFVVYGCIGLLDLYTGLYLIVISALEELGRIEDKAVFTVKKVAIVPLNHDGACEIMDKQGLAYDPYHLDVTRPPSSLGEDPSLSVSSSSAVSPAPTPTPTLDTEAAHEESGTDLASTAVTSAPRVKFALFSDSKKRKGQQHQDHHTAPSNTKPTLTITPAQGDRSEIPAAQETRSPPASPPQSPQSPTSGFFSKLKLNFVDQEHENQDQPSSSHISALSSSSSLSSSLRPTGSNNNSEPSSPSPQKPVATSDATPKNRKLSFDGFRNGRFSFGNSNRISTKDRDGTSEQASAVSSPTTSIPFDKSTDQELPQSSSITDRTAESSGLLLSTHATDQSSTSTAAPVAIKSPASGLDAAEAFISSAARQLGSWSEEVVSGLLPADRKTEAEEEAELELERNQSWDRKVIREISSFFSSGFYFSYDFNLLSSMQQRSGLPKNVAMPIWKQVNRRFWWNEHLQEELLEIEADEFILPIMQGFVEIEQCEIEEQAFEFAVISRRSRERSGLRYQRRGIDTDGHAANFVETEQLLRIVRDDSDHQVSFVQIRGSIPLFWSQSPYNLKPIPILERTAEENEAGFRRHFDDLLAQYGRQILVNLVEQHGREMIAGSAYTQYANKLNDPQIKLINKLGTDIHDLGYCWQTSNLDTTETSMIHQHQDQQQPPQFHILHTQKGAIRTNCMDCLDRTNVVQSALARYVLNQQLLRLGISSFPEHGLSVHERFEIIFNHVWANNGDAISRAYAGTSALKGDFTRTGKRNWQGMVNDATNSIARMYQNTFKDSFRQAAIDYMLGLTDVKVFKNLQTTAFGTAVVPAPVLPPLASSLSAAGVSEADVLASSSLLSLSPSASPKMQSLDAGYPQVVATTTTTTSNEGNISILSEVDGDVLWVDHLPTDDNIPAVAVTATAITAPTSFDKPDHVWTKIREAAIETSAEIVISPGENSWRGWTLLCCSNEVGSALPSASSSPSSSMPDPSTAKTASEFAGDSHGGKLWRDASNSTSSTLSSSSTLSDVFYDEKVVLLTDRALYICTYDYEMEKVLEFWRLALEKLTAIDKGTFIISTATPHDVDPVENYGFAVVYRANVQGETLRVNTGSVRNRRAMTGPMGNGGAKLEPLVEEEHGEEQLSHSNALYQKLEPMEDPLEKSTTNQDATAGERGGEGGKDPKAEHEKACLQQVRFKIVQHPETKLLPFVQSSSMPQDGLTAALIVPAAASITKPTTTTDTTTASPKSLRPTAQDCVELIVTEIIQARCELVQAHSPLSSPISPRSNSSIEGVPSPSARHHHRSPSEEYSFSSSTIAVNLEIRDRILQDAATAAKLEAHSAKWSAKMFPKKQQNNKKKGLGLLSTSTSRTEKDGGKERRGGAGTRFLALLTPSSNKRSSQSTKPVDESHQSNRALVEEAGAIADATNITTTTTSTSTSGKARLGFSPFKSSKGSLSMVSLLGGGSSSPSDKSHVAKDEQQPPSGVPNLMAALSPSPSSKGWFGRKRSKQMPAGLAEPTSVASSSSPSDSGALVDSRDGDSEQA